MAKITATQVADAEDELLRVKKAHKDAPNSAAKLEKYQDTSREVTDLRRAFREQEEAAGTRVGFVGGDAAQSDGGNG